MFISELALLISIFALCLFLAYEDLRSAFVFFLLVSPLLHKEVFSLVRWDVLPVRVVILSIVAVCGVRLIIHIKKKGFGDVKAYLKDPMLQLLLALWLVRAVSMSSSLNILASLLVFSFFTTMVFLYVLISFLANKYGSKFVLISIKFYTLIAFATAFIGLLQFLLDKYFGIIFGALWRIPGKSSRVGSVFWDVNQYAGYLSAVIPIVLGLLLTSKTRFSKVVYAFMFAFMSVILVLTNSRSAWAGFAVSMFVMVVQLLTLKFGKKGILLIVIPLVLFASGVGIEYQRKGSPVREKIKSYIHYRGDSFASHLMLLRGAYEIFLERPYLGGGYGSFYEHFKNAPIAPDYYARDPAALSVRVPAHSVWGEALAETGFIGTFILLLFAVYLLSVTYMASEAVERERRPLFYALGAGCLGFLVSGVFYSYNSEFFYIILFLAFIYAKSNLLGLYSFERISAFLETKKSFFLLFSLLFAVVLIFVNLGSNYLIPWDEAIYAKISRNMVETGEYLNLYWEQGKIWLEKPPFYMWMSAAAMKVFGVGSFSVKLPSALMGLTTILAVFYIGKKYFSIYVGFLASIILLTTTKFLFYSRIGMLDVSLTAFMTLSFLFYLEWVHKRTSSWYPIISGIFLGLAVMTKGVVGLVILPVFAVGFSYYCIKYGRAVLDDAVKGSVKFFGIFLLVLVPWHLYQYAQFGEDFVETYLIYHVFKRASESIEGKGQPLYWYVIVLKTSMRIWFVPLCASIIVLTLKPILARINFINSKLKISELVRNRNIYHIALWFALVFVFFSVSISKLYWYITPAYPAAALLSAYFIMGCVNYLITVSNSQKITANGSFIRLVSVLFLACFGLAYLQLVRGLAYAEDSTGQKARLVLAKDALTGATLPLYYDHIEKPLALFYTNGPIESVDYTPLVKNIEDARFDEPIVFITKESRFEKISGLFPNVIELSRETDFVLGLARSREEVLTEQIRRLEEEIKWTNEASVKGNPDAIANIKNLGKITENLLLLKDLYELEKALQLPESR